MNTNLPQSQADYGVLKTPGELDELLRTFRKQKHLTLERIAGLSHLSTKFLSELERGKETAELGKALSILNKIGLEFDLLKALGAECAGALSILPISEISTSQKTTYQYQEINTDGE